MSMSDHIKQQDLQEFFAKKVSFSWKTAKLDSFVLPEWENQHTYCLFEVDAAWGTVLICFTMCGAEQPKSVSQCAAQNNRKNNPK